MVKTLVNKKQQSSFVIMGILKYSVKMLVPKIMSSNDLKERYFKCIAQIIHLIKLTNDSEFDSMKINLLKAIEARNIDELQYLVLNFEMYPDNDTVIRKKNLEMHMSLIGDSEFNTETSTKLDNKLEISIKEVVSSTRNLKIISPRVIKSESSSNLTILKSDQLKFSVIRNKIKLPFLCLAVDATLNSIQMKRIFINEMTK
jgi:hypothetical protein